MIPKLSLLLQTTPAATAAVWLWWKISTQFLHNEDTFGLKTQNIEERKISWIHYIDMHMSSLKNIILIVFLNSVDSVSMINLTVVLSVECNYIHHPKWDCGILKSWCKKNLYLILCLSFYICQVPSCESMRISSVFSSNVCGLHGNIGGKIWAMS